MAHAAAARLEKLKLDRLAALERAIPRTPWFSAVGEALTEADEAESALYLSGLGRPGLAVVPVAGWREAKTIADDPSWDESWWASEETMRSALMADAAAALGEAALHRALTGVTEAARETLQGAAAIAATRAGIADAALIKAAAGAASQACFQAGLALIADAGDRHPFAAKLRLFESGRWPLGIIDRRFYLF